MVQKTLQCRYALDSQKFRRMLQCDEVCAFGDERHASDVNVSRRLKLILERVPD
jgi:hypothetical protein